MKKYFFVMILLVGVQSCKIDSTDEYEMKVLIEIFDDLIEEMGVLGEQKIPPPPSILVFDNNNAMILLNIKRSLMGLRQETEI